MLCPNCDNHINATGCQACGWHVGDPFPNHRFGSDSTHPLRPGGDYPPQAAPPVPDQMLTVSRETLPPFAPFEIHVAPGFEAPSPEARVAPGFSEGDVDYYRGSAYISPEARVAPGFSESSFPQVQTIEPSQDVVHPDLPAPSPVIEAQPVTPAPTPAQIPEPPTKLIQ